MTIRHLRIFTKVYEARRITQAAEQLHMTQPAVSRAIQELEGYYGVKLFERIKRRLLPTECGRQTYAQARHILDAFDAMELGLKNYDAAGDLRVGASVTLGNTLLPELARAYHRSHPQARLTAQIANASSLLEALAENRLDLALLEGALAGEEFCLASIGSSRLVLLVPPGHALTAGPPVPLEALAEAKLLLRERGSAVRGWLEQLFAQRGLALRPCWESVSTQAILQAVAAGLGISILPAQLAAEALERGEVEAVRWVGEAQELPRYLVWHRDKFRSAAMEDFFSLCRNQANQES